MRVTTVVAAVLLLASSGIAEKLPQKVRSDGFVQSWLVLGPIGGEDRWTTDHLASAGGTAAAEPTPGEPLADLAWREVAIDDDGLLRIGEQNHSVAYACARLESGVERDVLLRLGVDDGYALWINGEKVAERHTNGSLKADQEQKVARLQAGINRIMLKVDNFTGGWGFYFRVVDLDKTPNVGPQGMRSWLKNPSEQEIANTPWDMGIVVPDTPIEATVRLSPKVVNPRISPMLFGSVVLWWEGYTAPVGDAESRTWKLFDEMGITCLRFPGGADCHPYRWESVAETKRVYQAAEMWKHWHTRTTPEGHYEYRTFLDLCRKYGIEPILQVSTMTYWAKQKGLIGWTSAAEDPNVLETVVQYAADWVRDARQNGYNVKYWEIGNEEGCYYAMTGQRYGQFVRKFVKAMKAVDPDIKIIATGHRHEWNMGLLKEAGDQIDYLSYHYWALHEPMEDYPPGLGLAPSKFFTPEDLQQAPLDQLYVSHLAAMDEGKKNLEYDLFTPIAELAPKTKVAWTEWNWPGFGSRFNYSIAQALLNVEQMMHMAAKDCRIGIYWAATGWNFQMLAIGQPYPYYPMGDAFRLMRQHLRGQMRQATVETPTVAVKEATVPLVRAHWCKDQKHWAVFVLNHHPTQPAKVTLPDLAKLVGKGEVTVTRLQSPYLTQGAAENEAHADRHSVTDEKTDLTATPMELTLKPHSMAVIWRANDEQ